VDDNGGGWCNAYVRASVADSISDAAATSTDGYVGCGAQFTAVKCGSRNPTFNANLAFNPDGESALNSPSAVILLDVFHQEQELLRHSTPKAATATRSEGINTPTSVFIGRVLLTQEDWLASNDGNLFVCTVQGPHRGLHRCSLTLAVKEWHTDEDQEDDHQLTPPPTVDKLTTAETETKTKTDEEEDAPSAIAENTEPKTGEEEDAPAAIAENTEHVVSRAIRESVAVNPPLTKLARVTHERFAGRVSGLTHCALAAASGKVARERALAAVFALAAVPGCARRSLPSATSPHQAIATATVSRLVHTVSRLAASTTRRTTPPAEEEEEEEDDEEEEAARLLASGLCQNLSFNSRLAESLVSTTKGFVLDEEGEGGGAAVLLSQRQFVALATLAFIDGGVLPADEQQEKNIMAPPLLLEDFSEDNNVTIAYQQSSENAHSSSNKTEEEEGGTFVLLEDGPTLEDILNMEDYSNSQRYGSLLSDDDNDDDDNDDDDAVLNDDLDDMLLLNIMS
jgi:hypothetical protein